LPPTPNAYSPTVRAKVDLRIRITGEIAAQGRTEGREDRVRHDAGVSKHGRNATNSS